MLYSPATNQRIMC